MSMISLVQSHEGSTTAPVLLADCVTTAYGLKNGGL